MKKTSLRYWFAMLLILLVASFLVVGCKSKKSTITEETNTKDSSRNVIEIDYKKEINKAVADSIAKFLPTIKLTTNITAKYITKGIAIRTTSIGICTMSCPLRLNIITMVNNSATKVIGEIMGTYFS